MARLTKACQSDGPCGAAGQDLANPAGARDDIDQALIRDRATGLTLWDAVPYGFVCDFVALCDGYRAS